MTPWVWFYRASRPPIWLSHMSQHTMPRLGQPSHVTSKHPGSISKTSETVTLGVFRSRQSPFESKALDAGHSLQSRSNICWKHSLMASRPAWVLLKSSATKLRFGSCVSSLGAFCPICVCFGFVFALPVAFVFWIFFCTLVAKGPVCFFCPLCMVVPTVQVSSSEMCSKAFADASESSTFTSPVWSSGNVPAAAGQPVGPTKW